MGMILRIASSRIVGQGDIVGRSGYFSLNLSANSVMRGRLDARRTLKSLVADLRCIKEWATLLEPKSNTGICRNNRISIFSNRIFYRINCKIFIRTQIPFSHRIHITPPRLLTIRIKRKAKQQHNDPK